MNLRLLSTRAPFSISSFFLRHKIKLATLACAAALSVGVSHGYRADDTLLAPGNLPADDTASLTGQRYELKLHHTHTNEDIDVVYRIGNTYVPEALEQLNHFLRDHRTQTASHYDPREFDLLHNLLSRLDRGSSVIDIVCGYRTPWSNNYLRTRSAHTGVAKESQHMEAKAIDIRIPGVTTAHLRDVAESLQAGGVGYYPSSQFVHVDVGPERTWTFGGGSGHRAGHARSGGRHSRHA